jgi:hypothetical protein
MTGPSSDGPRSEGQVSYTADLIFTMDRLSPGSDLSPKSIP